MKRRNIAIMAMLALTAGQAFAQRCLPQMKGIEVKVGIADGVYNGKKSALCFRIGSYGAVRFRDTIMKKLYGAKEKSSVIVLQFSGGTTAFS